MSKYKIIKMTVLLFTYHFPAIGHQAHYTKLLISQWFVEEWLFAQ